MSAKRDFWMARTYFCCRSAVTASIALFDPDSQHAFSFFASGFTAGKIGITCMLTLALLGLLDLVINDWIQWPSSMCARIKHKRFLLYMFLSIAHGSLIYVNLAKWNIEPVLLSYSVDVLFGFALGTLLVLRRYSLWRSTTLY